MNRRNFMIGMASLSAPQALMASSSQVFANIGDYGNWNNPAHGKVANLVKSWSPDAVITNGDNSYTYDYHRDNAAYSSFISSGTFFPTLGNHDRDKGAGRGSRHFDYFKLPAYYYRDFDNIRFIMVDSTKDFHSQVPWLTNLVKTSPKKWNVAAFHYPPYSSGGHGSLSSLRSSINPLLIGAMPDGKGLDIVLTGHDHHYERLHSGEAKYIVNGLGGKSIYDVGSPLSNTEARYNGNYGAMKMVVTRTTMTCDFINISNSLIDSFSMRKAPNMAPIINLLLS